MIDRSLVLTKAGRVEAHIRRIKEKRSISLKQFLDDLDRQESILFNLQMAIQNCIDIAAHIISDEDLGVAGSINEMFYMLQKNGYLNAVLTEKMVASVGFRNLIVHEYGNVDLEKVYQISHQSIEDLEDYLKAIINKAKKQTN